MSRPSNRHLPPSPVRKLSLFLSLPCVSPVELSDEREGEGRGEARSQIIRRPRESLALYKLFNRYSLKFAIRIMHQIELYTVP
jgi:hypothetical protein